MIENRRRTSAETQKRLERLRDGRGQVNSGCGFKIFARTHRDPPPRISRSATVASIKLATSYLPVVVEISVCPLHV